MESLITKEGLFLSFFIEYNTLRTISKKYMIDQFPVQYLQINKNAEPLLVVTTSIMGTIYRGVIKDEIFWFLVEDLVPIQNRLTLIEKLLTNISKEHKGFINAVDARGNIREILMVSIEGLKSKLFYDS